MGGPTAGSVAPEDDEDDDDDWEESEPSYTWLHYIILLVVAFVLGVLLWNLVLKGPDVTDFGTEDASGTVSTLAVGSLG